MIVFVCGLKAIGSVPEIVDNCSVPRSGLFVAGCAEGLCVSEVHPCTDTEALYRPYGP